MLEEIQQNTLVCDIKYIHTNPSVFRNDRAGKSKVLLSQTGDWRDMATWGIKERVSFYGESN